MEGKLITRFLADTSRDRYKLRQRKAERVTVLDMMAGSQEWTR